MAVATSDLVGVTDTHSTAADEPQQFDIRRLGQRLNDLLRTSSSESVATDRLLELTYQLTGAVLALYYAEDTTEQLASEPTNQFPPQRTSDAALEQLYSLALHARSDRTVQMAVAKSDRARVAIAIPVFCRRSGLEVLVLLCDGETDERRRLAGIVQISQFLAAYAGQWRGNFEPQQVVSERFTEDSLIAALQDGAGARSFLDAAKRFANYCSTQLGARYVAVAVRRRGGLAKLIAMSEPYDFERGSPLVSWLESALAEVMTDDAEHFELDRTGRPTESIQELCKLVGTEQLHRLPLCDAEGRAFGACIAISDQLLTASDQDSFKQATQIWGPVLALWKNAKSERLKQLRAKYAALSAKGKQACWAIALAMGVTFFAVPLPHRVQCRCEIQPVTRRYIAAPYEGRLETALVEPGDFVEKGQVLARMDGREIRIELSELEFEYKGATKQRDQALANNEHAAAQIALNEMKRLQARRELFEDRLNHLEIRSTTTGVVLSGDPTKLEGSRLTIGKTLVEVGPLDNMIVELAIADEDVAHTRVGQSVRFRLASMPQRKFQGVVKRIHPRSELRESQNVFIAEVDVEASSDLRPGMQGKAKIHAGHKSLAWILFHRAIDQLRFRIGW